MNVIPPLDLTASSRITSTNVSEPDASVGETAWSNASVAYTVGQERVRTTTHRRYRCLVDHTSAASPLPENDPTRWADAGPTNAYAMFDTIRNTATVRTSPITVQLTPGQRVNALALLGLQAQSVTATVTSVLGGGTVYSTTTALQTRDTAGWRDYLFGQFRLRKAVALFDLPLYTDAIITVTISHASASVKCGALVLGMSEFLGSAELRATSDVLNFSTVDRAADGTATLTQRRNVPVTKQRTLFPKGLVPKLVRLRDDLNAVPAVWATTTDEGGYFEAFLILGFHRRFLISADHPMHATADFEIEEV
jgi:hypothetical protein